MSTLADLQASTAALTAKVAEGNAKTDALIVVANTTIDALVALKAETSGITPASLQAIIDQQAAAIASITKEEARVDAAAVAVAPPVAAAPATAAAPSTPTPTTAPAPAA